MKTLYLVVVTTIYLFNIPRSFAQSFIFYGSKTYGGDGRDSRAMILDAGINQFVIAGTSNTNISGDKTVPLCSPWIGPSLDNWLLKIDTSFNVLWNKNIGGNNIDADPNIIMTGFNKEMIFSCCSRSDSSCDKSANNISFPSNNNDYWICKIDSNGNKIWDKTFGGTDDDDYPHIIKLTSGNFVAIGTSSSQISGDKTIVNHGGSDFWAVKLDSNGTCLWNNVYGGTGNEANYSGGTNGNRFAIIPCANDGFLLACITFSGAGGDITEPSYGASDIWIIKCDSSGNKLWDRRLGGSGDEGVSSIIQTNDLGFLICGNTGSPVGGCVTDTSRGSADCWIIKLDSLGNKQWDKRYGGNNGDFGISVALAPGGGYWISGDTDSDSSSEVSEQTFGGIDYWMLKIDSAGNKIWDKRFGGPGDDHVYNFIIMPDSSIFLFGNADTGTSILKPEWGNGGYDYWLVHFKYGFNQSIDGIAEAGTNVFSIYPNPSSDYLQMVFNVPLMLNTPLQIFDLTGRMVYSKQINSNEKKVTIDVSLFSQGTYFVKVNSTVRKIVKM